MNTRPLTMTKDTPTTWVCDLGLVRLHDEAVQRIGLWLSLTTQLLSIGPGLGLEMEVLGLGLGLHGYVPMRLSKALVLGCP